MKVINQPIRFYNQEFVFNNLLGCLISRDYNPYTEVPCVDLQATHPSKSINLEVVNDPFKMKRRARSNEWKALKHPKMTAFYARLLTWTSTHCYLFIHLLAKLKLNLFADAGDAAMFYYNVYPDMRRQHTLCLPRALFIATTSKRFKKHGTLFIGTFLPTVRMHAWVMEDGMQADRYDNQWIYYRPVQMML